MTAPSSVYHTAASASLSAAKYHWNNGAERSACGDIWLDLPSASDPDLVAKSRRCRGAGCRQRWALWAGVES